MLTLNLCYMDPGRSPLGSPQKGQRKRLTSPFRKLKVSTSPRCRSLSMESELSDPGTPYNSDRYSHTTFTTYKKGTKYTRYVIRKVPRRAFNLDQRPDIFRTTFKTLKLDDAGKATWYTRVHVWMNDTDNKKSTPECPSSPSPRMRAISDLERGQMSPRRFSLDGLSSPLH